MDKEIVIKNKAGLRTLVISKDLPEGMDDFMDFLVAPFKDKERIKQIKAKEKEKWKQISPIEKRVVGRIAKAWKQEFEEDLLISQKIHLKQLLETLTVKEILKVFREKLVGWKPQEQELEEAGQSLSYVVWTGLTYELGMEETRRLSDPSAYDFLPTTSISQTEISPLEDCFGRFYDSEVEECQSCLQSENCEKMMN